MAKAAVVGSPTTAAFALSTFVLAMLPGRAPALLSGVAVALVVSGLRLAIG